MRKSNADILVSFLKELQEYEELVKPHSSVITNAGGTSKVFKLIETG